MVMTTSAPSTASAVDPARVQPCSTAFASASSLRSKARTSWPALARFGAIPPPIWPRPMNAILVILASLPVPRALFDEGAHAFLLVLSAEQAVEQPPLEIDALRQRHFEGGVDHFLGGDRGQRRHAGDLAGDLQRL